MSEIINGYLIEKPLRTENSGFSKWGFGTKEGRKYFIKEFISPVYPMDEKLIGEQLAKTQKKLCNEYEQQKRLIYGRINEVSDGNVVKVQHFFRYGSKYYITTECVNSVPLCEVIKLNLENKIILCTMLAHSLMQLHQNGIAHADIKVDNILFKRTSTGMITGKIIDIDNSFWDKEAPKDTDEVLGDQVYMAPEAFLMMWEEKGQLTHQIDTFAMGIIFHEILTGKRPNFNPEYQYAYEALLEGESLEIDPGIPAPLRQVLLNMLKKDPGERSELEDVFNDLIKVRQALFGYIPQPMEEEQARQAQNRQNTAAQHRTVGEDPQAAARRAAYEAAYRETHRNEQNSEKTIRPDSGPIVKIRLNPPKKVEQNTEGGFFFEAGDL